MSLDDPAQPTAPRPWWRRLLDPSGKEAPWAGQRPRLRRSRRILGFVVPLVVIVVLIVATFHLGAGIQAVRDHFAKHAAVHPAVVDESGTRSVPGNGPAQAFDGYSNTWWASAVTGSYAGQWVQTTFSSPVDLLDLIITPIGTAGTAGLVSPRSIEVDVWHGGDHPTQHVLNLDQSSPQYFTFHDNDVTRMRFIVDTVYDPSPDSRVAIAEIEFFGPSSSGEQALPARPFVSVR